MCGGGCGGCCSPCSGCGLGCDPCWNKMCCRTRRPFSFCPFVPSYDRCCEDTKMGKLIGMDYQRRWFCERNVWMCKVYGQCGGGCCC